MRNQLLLPAIVFRTTTHTLQCVSPCWSGNILSHIVILVVFTVGVSQLVLCHQRAGRLEDAIHLAQQCIEILRKSLPSTRKNLCVGEYSMRSIFYWHEVMSSDCTSATITRLLKELFQACLPGCARW